MPEQLCSRYVSPDRHRNMSTDGTNETISADDADVAVVGNVHRIVEPGQIGWIKRRDDHAIERSIDILDAPRELDRPLPRYPPDHRLADEQIIAAGADMNAKMFAVAEIQSLWRRGIGGAQDVHAVRTDHGDLHDLIVEQLDIAQPAPETIRIRDAGIARGGNLGGAVGLPERAGEM